MLTVQALKEKAEALHTEAQAIMTLVSSENREPTVEEQARFDAIAGKREGEGLLAEVRAQIEKQERIEKEMAIIGAKKVSETNTSAPVVDTKVIKVPARAKAACKLHGHKTVEEAYTSGQFVRAALLKDAKARAWCKEHGVKATMTTFDNQSAGVLVPEAMEDAVIRLREQYGVFRQEAQNVSMPAPKWKVPKQTNEITGYWMAEGNNITASDLNFHMIELDAKKLAAVTQVTSELNEDAVVSIGELVASSVAQTFARMEDEAGFLGNGASTYGGVVGLASAIATGSVVTATSRQTFSALTLADFESMVGARKMWTGPSSPKWYISQAGYAASMLRLVDAAGGVTMAELVDGAPRMMFLGYPVVISQTLNSALTGTSGQRALYFGDLSQTAILGTRRGISLSIDNSLGFLNETIYIRASERVDIVVHDRGTASASGGFIALNFG